MSFIFADASEQMLFLDSFISGVADEWFEGHFHKRYSTYEKETGLDLLDDAIVFLFVGMGEL